MKRHLLGLLALLLCFVLVLTSCNGSVEEPTTPDVPGTPEDPDNPPDTVEYSIEFIAEVPEELAGQGFSVTGLADSVITVKEGEYITAPEGVRLENRNGFFVVSTGWTNADGLSIDSPVNEDRTYKADWAGIVNISNAEELVAWLESDDNTSSVQLNSDIDMSSVPWVAKEEFLGCFMGNNHSISNLTTSSEAGLISFIANGAAVEDLSLRNISYTNTDMVPVGGIAARSSGTILNCSVTGSISANGTIGGIVGEIEGGSVEESDSEVQLAVESDQTAGGIFGAASMASQISNNESNCIITTSPSQDEITYMVGGIGGSMSGGSTVEDCVFTGEVLVAENASGAGIIGMNDGGIISSCTNRGSLSYDGPQNGRSSDFAGIVGQNLSGTVSACVNEYDFNLEGTYNGLDVAGIAYENSGVVTDCENNCQLIAEPGSEGAGIVFTNNNGTIENCANNAGIEINSASGIVQTDSNGRILNCVNNADRILSKGSAAGIVGRADNTTIIGCVNNAELTSVYNTMADSAGGIAGSGSCKAIIGCANTAEIYNYSNAYGIARGSSESYIVACYNSGSITGQSIGYQNWGAISNRDYGNIITCVCGAGVDPVESGSSNNIKQVFWNGITWEEAVDYMNGGIDTWNADCDQDLRFEYHYVLGSNGIPATEPGSPSGGSPEEPGDSSDLKYIFNLLSPAIDVAKYYGEISNDGTTTTYVLDGVSYTNGAGNQFVFYATYVESLDNSTSPMTMVKDIDITEGTTIDGEPHTGSWIDDNGTLKDVIIDGTPIEI